MVSYLALPRDLRILSLATSTLLSLVITFVTHAWVRGLLAVGSATAVLVVSWLRDYEVRFGRPGADTYAGVFQSDPGEAWRYFLNVLSLRSLILAVATGLAVWCLRQAANRVLRADSVRRGLGRPYLTHFATATALLVTAGVALAWSPLQERIEMFRRSVAQFERDIALQRELLAQLKASTPTGDDSQGVPPASLEGTVVVVIGESISRRHMSLYGYFRPTTPRLEARRQDLLIHGDTISPHSHTVPSLQEVLTPASLEDGVAFRAAFRNSLMAELRRAGYRTWWLSNQAEYGLWDNPIALLGKEADVAKFLTRSGRRLYGDGFYDDSLLPYLDAALSDGAARRFVVLHTLAGHNPYCRFIPEDDRNVLLAGNELGAKYFGSAKDRSHDLNCYDNAIHYADRFLDQVIRRVEARPEPALLAYISDHGEDVGAGTMHDAGAHSAYHVEIPHLWYFNSAARKVLQDKIAVLRSHMVVPYKSSDHFHTLLDVVGAAPSRFSLTRALASREFRSRTRSTVPRAELAESIAYDDLDAVDRKDHLELSRLVMKEVGRRMGEQATRRLWSHRTNSIGKLLEAKTVFAGAELDIVFDAAKDEFFVYHPPAPNVGLSLGEYLAATRDRTDFRFWFDWKNAVPETFESAFAVLKAHDRRFGLRPRTIVETPTTATFSGLKGLSAYGFLHSYYMPTDEIVRCSKSPLASSCDSLAISIAQTAEGVGATMISFDSDGRDFVERNAEAFGGFRRATWALRLSSTDPATVTRLTGLDRYEAVLIHFPSRMNN